MLYLRIMKGKFSSLTSKAFLNSNLSKWFFFIRPDIFLFKPLSHTLIIILVSNVSLLIYQNDSIDQYELVLIPYYDTVCVQAVVTHFIYHVSRKLLHKMGHDSLDTQYYVETADYYLC